MAQLALYPLLLALILPTGTSTQGKITLETIPNDVEEVTCTEGLLCESSDRWCMPGDKIIPDIPVLVPTDIRSKTTKKCNGEGCWLCLQVTMDISVAFLSEGDEELGSGDCDYDDYYNPDTEEEEEEATSAVNLYLGLNKSNNGSFLCANLYMYNPRSLPCYEVKVEFPVSSVPRGINTSSVKVGSLVYNCVRAVPGSDMTITSYTVPRYFDELIVNHEFPGCPELDAEENILECEVPTMDIVVGENVSIGIINGTDRNVKLWRYYNSTFKANNTTILRGDQRYSFPKSDIVPCLCFQAWYDNRTDAFRDKMCPFSDYSEETTLSKTSLSVTLGNNILFYKLSAPCNVTAEFSLCWKSSDQSKCVELPHSRKKILSEQKKAIRLELLHPSVCAQVSVKGEVLHTNCSLYEGTHQKSYEDAIVLVSDHNSTKVSLCLVEESSCNILYNATHQMRSGVGFIEQKIVEDFMSEKCLKIWKTGEGHYVYVCSMDKYMRSKWNWSRAVCLMVIACVLLIIILKNKHLKMWIKSVTAEKSLGEIFRDRRVLILYSPDNPAYETLVQVFASSLKDLKLDVVLDQWHRVEMGKINPLPWYHQQKSLVSEKKGLIILLFSEGARERYIAWRDRKPVDLDPYSSFGAVLNCVHPNFRDGMAKGLYVVARFSSSSQNVIPELFKSVPVYTLPLNLVKLLRELAGNSDKKLGRKQVNQLAATITNRLQTPMLVCQDSMVPDGSVSVELQPLMVRELDRHSDNSALYSPDK
ncbi:interleukin-17 receptor C [Mixophyes fleayi]|uniref:interleukin-17 receptor C n=1 Tax=Mixophyes fleayi TaxID=3061075 RepID=UPI003F4DB9B3